MLLPGLSLRNRTVVFTNLLMLAYGARRETGFQLAELHSGTDVSEVLVPPLELLNVGCQVGIHHADGGIMKLEPNGHSSFVSLSSRDRKGRGNCMKQ